MKSILLLLLVSFGFALVAGCGSDNSATVIEPGPDYQLTTEEQEMKANEDAMRGK